MVLEMNAQKAQNINFGQEAINLDDFVNKVIASSIEGYNHNPDERSNWELIGKRASRFSKRAFTMDFMVGPLSVQQKKHKRTRTGKITRNKEDSVMPAQLIEGDIQKQENETSNNANSVYNILKELGPINYFKFVTNPESFSQTVQNIFYVSFLAGKGVASITTISGQPMLEIMSAQGENEIKDVVNKKQIIMGIDKKD